MITIQTIADIANVSKSTVSNAFNNPNALSSETREHIFKICQQNNYRKDFFEKQKNLHKEKIFEFNIYQLEPFSEFSQKILKGVIEECQLFNIKVLINPRNIPLIYDNIENPIVDGRIVIHPTLKDQYHRTVPTVLIGKTPKQIKHLSQVNNNNVELISEATRLLLNLDHRNILFLNGSKNHTVSHERLWGFKQTLFQHNILYSPTNHHMIPNNEDVDYYVYNLIKNKPFILDNITAIIVDNTYMAKGVYKALEERNFKIPEDISIISLSKNCTTERFIPHLSYFDLRPETLGKTAVQKLMKMLQGEASSEIIIEHKFVSEQSVSYAKRPQIHL